MMHSANTHASTVELKTFRGTESIRLADDDDDDDIPMYIAIIMYVQKLCMFNLHQIKAYLQAMLREYF